MGVDGQAAVFDAAVIGGGLLGCFCALNLSRRFVRTILLEKREDVCTGISRANTAVIYPGYDNHPGSLKTNLTLKANQDLDRLCRQLDVPYRRCGSLLVSCGPKGDQTVQKKYRQGLENGVPGLRLLSARETLKMEPGLTKEVTLSLYAPSSATVHPWEFGIAAWEAAKELGLDTKFCSEVTAIWREKDHFCLEINQEQILRSRTVVNGAGILADQVHALYQEPLIRIRPELAEYVLLEPEDDRAPGHIIFCETEDHGKGITLVPTVNGKILAGTVNRLAEADAPLATSALGREKLREAYSQIFPSLADSMIVRSFAGLRPNPYRPDHPKMRLCGLEPLITETKDGLVSLIGIKTPGLTCANELGKRISSRVLEFLNRKDAGCQEILPRRRYPEYLEATEHQRIICRCEQITEGAILEAIQRGAGTIDGVKRRTGSGMGLCQGSYCSARIAGLLADRVSALDGQVMKDGRDSYYLYQTGEQDQV